MAKTGSKKSESGKTEKEKKAQETAPNELETSLESPSKGNADEPKETESKQEDAPNHETVNDELSAERNKYLRLAAEYDNFRKRSAKEREMIFTDARADTIAKLLPVYDNLERALKMECSDEAYYKGIELTMTQLLEILEGMDIKPIPAIGEPFDPNLHNAVMTVENPELGSKIIAEEFQKGFILGEKVIRFSTVVVAN